MFRVFDNFSLILCIHIMDLVMAFNAIDYFNSYEQFNLDTKPQ